MRAIMADVSPKILTDRDGRPPTLRDAGVRPCTSKSRQFLTDGLEILPSFPLVSTARGRLSLHLHQFSYNSTPSAFSESTGR